MKRSPLRKHANEQPADRIAAEAAAREIYDKLLIATISKQTFGSIARPMSNIIQAAINKVTKQFRREISRMANTNEKLGQAIASRAAHASEECVICGGTRIKGHKQDCPNYEPAHASDEGWWTCRCHGYKYGSPETCEHTTDLIPPAHASEISTAARTDFRDIAPPQSADTKRLAEIVLSGWDRHCPKDALLTDYIGIVAVSALHAAMQKEKE